MIRPFNASFFDLTGGLAVTYVNFTALKFGGNLVKTLSLK
jgi:hypothetical protein